MLERLRPDTSHQSPLTTPMAREGDLTEILSALHLAPILDERFLISRRESLSLKKTVCLQTRAVTLQHDL
jgi:hypothetical protein